MADNKASISNKQAYRDFYIEKTYEAGLELFGSEVKSIREGKANLKGSFARVERGEVLLYGMHITPYKFSREDTDPIRARKLLLHKKEIRYIEEKLTQKGYALVPLKVYFKRSYAKVEIGLGRGKKLYDKREALKEKQAKREVERALRHKHR